MKRLDYIKLRETDWYVFGDERVVCVNMSNIGTVTTHYDKTIKKVHNGADFTETGYLLEFTMAGYATFAVYKDYNEYFRAASYLGLTPVEMLNEYP